MNSPVTADDAQMDRIGELALDDGSTVIYDRDNPDAWIQSDLTLEL